MKISKLVILIIIATIMFVSCTNRKKHIGEWKGLDKGKPADLILDKTNHATFIIDNHVFGGNDYKLESNPAECKYDIDYSKEPIWFDIVLYQKEGNVEKVRLKGILRFITDTKIEYRVSFKGERFTEFDPKDTENTIVLDKVKK